jgi:hypothetical protein
MGVRKRLSEDSLKQTYRLNGVQTGSAVIRKVRKYGTWQDGYYIGVIVRRTASSVQVRWWGNDDIVSYSQGDARYEVDRDRWKILGVMRGNPLDPDNPIVDALTQMLGDYRVSASASPDNPTPPTEETEDMEASNAAREREAAQRALANGDLKDRETYTAKQVATRCGTDAKTMRKFFRSAHSTVEPVGQGGRYEFAAKDLPKIKKEFTSWSKRSAGRTPVTTPKAKTIAQIHTEEEAIKDAQHEDLSMQMDGEEDSDSWGAPIDREPTPEELEQLDDLTMDLDDLDAEDE